MGRRGGILTRSCGRWRCEKDAVTYVTHVGSHTYMYIHVSYIICTYINTSTLIHTCRIHIWHKSGNYVVIKNIYICYLCYTCTLYLNFEHTDSTRYRQHHVVRTCDMYRHVQYTRCVLLNMHFVHTIQHCT
jgi:hypothetical protein